MAKKVMIMPSARSRYINTNDMRLIYKILQVVAVIMVFSNWYMYGFMYGVKLAVMVVVALFVTRETEILFYSHDKDLTRQESKELIENSFYRNTAILFVLIIPLSTPVWLTAVGAVLATLLGKLLFGGFHHMVFHSSLVGYIFLTEGWPSLVDGVKFTTAFDNYLLGFLDNDFFNKTLSLSRLFGGQDILFDAGNIETALSSIGLYSITDLMTGLVPGVLFSGVLLLFVLLYLIVKKHVNYIVPTVTILSFLVVTLFTNQFDLNVMLYHLFSGSFLFIVVFISIDPITTPIPSVGKIIFGVIAGALTVFIRNGSTYEEGIVFGLLFMMMLTPMLNTVFKPQPVKKVQKKDVA